MLWAKCVTNGESPSPRHSCGIAILENTLYLFGGTTYGIAFDDLWTLDLSNIILLCHFAATWTWKKSEIDGPKPSALWGHSFHSIGSKLFVSLFVRFTVSYSAVKTFKVSFFQRFLIKGPKADLWVFDTSEYCFFRGIIQSEKEMGTTSTRWSNSSSAILSRSHCQWKVYCYFRRSRRRCRFVFVRHKYFSSLPSYS